MKAPIATLATLLLTAVAVSPAQQHTISSPAGQPLLYAGIRGSSAPGIATGPALHPSSTPSLTAARVPEPEPEPAYTLRKSVREVRLDFSVTDKSGRAVTGLQRSDLVISDDGQFVSGITALTQENDIPLRIAVLVDTSWSTAKDLQFEKEAVLRFLSSVVAPQDQALVAGFANKLICVQSFTSDRAQLERSVEPIVSGGLTALNDALHQVVTEHFVKAERPADSRMRNVLVILTDGYDSYSLRGLNDGLTEAVRNGITIYTVSAANRVNSEGQKAIDRMTETTGGKAITAKRVSELDAAFAEVSRDLHSYYSVAYPAPERPGFHPVAISLSNSNTFKIRVRNGYFAEAGLSESAALTRPR